MAGRKVDEHTLHRYSRATRYVEKLPIATQQPRRGPRAVAGVCAETAIAEDDDRRSCNEAVAINLSGRDAEPGHALWVDGDATALDMTQLYPVAGAETVVASSDARPRAQTSSPTTWSSVISSNEDDDLFLFLGGGVPGGFDTALAAYLNAVNADASIGVPSGYTGALWDSRCELKTTALTTTVAWGDQIGNTTTLSFTNTMRAVLQLRGVTRTAVGTVLGPAGSEQSVVRNGIPSRFFAYQNVYSQSAGVPSETGWSHGFSGLTDFSYAIPAGYLRLDFYYSSNNYGNIPDSIPGYQYKWSWDNPGVVTVDTLQVKVSVLEADTPYTFEEPDITYTLSNGEGVNVFYQTLYIPMASATSLMPAIPCDPLVCTDYLRAAPLYGTGAAHKADARAVLDANRRRELVIPKSKISDGDEGTVLRVGGYAKAWVNVLDESHGYAGPPPENAERVAIYDTPVSGVYGKLGRYYRSAAAASAAAGSSGAIDPRVAAFAGLPQILHSQAEPGPFKLLKLGRADLTQPGAITVNVTATKTAESSVVMTGRWNNWTLSTGSDVDTDALWIVRADGGSSLTLYTGEYLLINLAEDATSLVKPVYGNPSQPVQVVESDSGQFRGVLVLNQWLMVEPARPSWLSSGVAIDDPQTDTFTFSDDAIDFGMRNYAPYYYIDPETGEFGEVSVDVDYAAWPEPLPTPPSLVPEGTDITAVPDGFDPMIGRVPGSVTALADLDRRTGLQLCFGRIVGWPDGAGGASGGCC